MQLNQGRFLSNGKSGYIPKPKYLRDTQARVFDPFTDDLIDGNPPASYTVTVISGHWLGTTNGVVVDVEMYGIPADTIRHVGIKTLILIVEYNSSMFDTITDLWY